MLAMERGEVEGASSSWAAVSVAKKDWLRDKKIKIILQTAPERIRELPDAPALPEIAPTPQDKQVYQLYASGSAVGRSLIAPPGIPADRVAMLREAFRATVGDPEFLADIRKLDVDLEPLPGEALAELIVRTLKCAASGARARQARVREMSALGSSVGWGLRRVNARLRRATGASAAVAAPRRAHADQCGAWARLAYSARP